MFMPCSLSIMGTILTPAAALACMAVAEIPWNLLGNHSHFSWLKSRRLEVLSIPFSLQEKRIIACFPYWLSPPPIPHIFLVGLRKKNTLKQYNFSMW